MESASEIRVVALLMTILIAGGLRPSAAAETDGDGRLVYRLTEEQPADTLVANVAGDSGLQGSEFRYVLINNNEPGLALFRIDGGGLLRTSDVVDRDALCPRRAACSVAVDVAAQRGQEVTVVKTRVDIADLNDNTPAFDAPEVEFHLAESTPPGMLFPLPVADDPDGPPNGVVGYRLSPESGKFAVQMQNLSAGDVDVRLVLNQLLDRQHEDLYTLSLVAFDGGHPQLSASTIIRIYVDDVRQYFPRFDNDSYEVLLPENSLPGSTVIQLHASSAPGAVIVYAFSRRTQTIYGRQFAINSTTGEVTLLNTVDRASYSLSVITSIIITLCKRSFILRHNCCIGRPALCVNTWIATHLPTPEGWKAELA